MEFRDVGFGEGRKSGQTEEYPWSTARCNRKTNFENKLDPYTALVWN